MVDSYHTNLDWNPQFEGFVILRVCIIMFTEWAALSRRIFKANISSFTTYLSRLELYTWGIQGQPLLQISFKK